jgi:trehalose 6-phosphate phosphatase
MRIQTNTRLVLISDRHCRTVDSLLGLHWVPEIWGVGGLERLLPDGSYELSSLDERALRRLAEADDWAEATGLLPWGEQKPDGIALLETTILTAEFNSMRSRAWTAWSEIATKYGLSLLNLEHGVEVRVRSRTRVEAVEAIISETHRSVLIAHLGDGVLSEFAFDALGARGMRVLVR